MKQITMNLDQSLESVFTEITINSRAWIVLEARVDQSLTLEETGKRLEGVSRERVRQIESKANAKLSKNLDVILPVLSIIENNLKGKSSFKFSGASEINAKEQRSWLEAKIKNTLNTSGWRADIEDVRKLILLIRAIVFLKRDKNRKSDAEKNWPRLTYSACRLAPSILNHKKVAKLEKHSRISRRKLSYKEIATQVLEEAEEPLHWTIIAERGYQLGRRKTFSTAALYNMLQGQSDTFVRVGQGTYALVEWGMKEASYYPEIISSILEQEKKPLPVDMIYARVNSIRPIKRQTVTMFLDMHPRFYKSIESTYGLRSWLPPREKQTLRTPGWLVEDSASFLRVMRAIERGYKVQVESEGDIG